jgi:hypothetical protein
MSKPSEVPEWATEATYDAPGETFDGTATKVDPGAALKAEGWKPKDQPPAQYHNWWQGKVGEWLTHLNAHTSADDDWVYPAAKERVTLLNLANLISAGPADPVFIASGTAGAMLYWQAQNAGAFHMRVPLNLPTGAVIKKVEFRWRPGTSADAIGRLTRNDFLAGQAENVASVTEPSGSSIVTSEIASINHPIVADRSYQIAVWCSNAVASSTRLEGIRVTWDDPGPRNY